MRVTATKLRQNLYHILDEILANGIPVEIERKGEVLKIVLKKSRKKLGNLEVHATITGDPLELVNLNWNAEWNEDKNL